MTRLHNDTVLERVRQAFVNASVAGEPKPGRPRLVGITGATEHQVRQAMAKLATLAAESPASPPAHHQNGQYLETTAPPPASTTTPLRGQEPAGETAPPPQQAGDASTHQHERQPRPWPLVLIGVAAAVAVWGGWVELGRYTGFGMVQPLPGVVDSLWINTAIVLPIGIEAYGGYAIRTWLSSSTLSKRTRRYARWSALASLVVGAGAQVASHLMRAANVTSAPWQVTVLVACVPVAVLGLATGLATLVRQDTTGPPAQLSEFLMSSTVCRRQ
jgi:hypothetical protein